MSPADAVNALQPAPIVRQETGRLTRRLICALALIPIVPAASVIGVLLIQRYFGLGPFDELRGFHLLFSAIWVAATIVIWRRAVVWTLGRTWLTALVNLIPFVQVVYGQAIWNAGWVRDDGLRVGQHEIGIGLWTWLVIWVWWGVEKTKMQSEVSEARGVAVRMTVTGQRIIASIASIPFLFGVFVMTAVALETLAGGRAAIAEAFAIAALIAIACWLAIWRRAVVWTRKVVEQTICIAVLTFAVPIAVQWFRLEGTSGALEAAITLAPVVGWGVWMFATVGVWPMAGSGRRHDEIMPRCLRCGYLLTGLTSTRCPECGDEPTIDTLWRGSTGAL